jgi:mRNA-degrading endonuclease toxin of MazEF toxin-antitoxin module
MANGSAVPFPRRGEIWTANLGNPPVRHWVLVVSVDSRNQSQRVDTVLIAPFGSAASTAPTTVSIPPGESGLPGPSWVKAHFVTNLKKNELIEKLPRALSSRRMREVCLAIRRAIDPDAQWEER